jgi:outer membrane protein TolC
VLAAVLLLAGCATAPEYRKPALDLPAAWKVDAPWRQGTPSDGAPKGPWWQGFGDPVLDQLEQQALVNSPSLALAGARLAQARRRRRGRSGPVSAGWRAGAKCASAFRPTGR